MDSHERMGIIASARNLDGQDFDIALRDIDGPGKFEGIHDKELALAVYTIAGHGLSDDETNSADLCAVQVGSVILLQNGIGSLGLQVMESPERADDYMAALNHEG